GNPLAARIGLEVVSMLETGEYQQRARDLEGYFGERLDELVADGLVNASRHVGLWAGVDANPRLGMTGREICEGLQARGVLAKDTHGSTIRLAPPLVIERDELAFAMDALADTLHTAHRELAATAIA
ncbi:MAG: aminotransferase class III-fold pyridoxal phosphate-dependent enzyme, partial [Actinobacteria bacterium]|nr:aminotransferase class III-fold pyridoxal phosphate-dependent enzyme [Actinomycetota bacterium]